MASPRSGITDAAVSLQSLRLQRASSRSDIFPKLIAMQKSLKARNFAVFRIAAAGLPNKRKLVCEMENWGTAGKETGAKFLEAFGERMIDHLEISLLPLVFHDTDGKAFVDLGDMSTLTKRMSAESLTFTGIAFPIRLGALSNGYVVFFSSVVELCSDLVVELHVRCNHVMMDLLALDERKNLPEETLSEREIACLQLAGDGQISEEIAEKLGLSVHTVNAYLGSATIKLDSVNRIQAIAKAIRLGYIH